MVPRGAEFIHVGSEAPDIVCVWAALDSDAPKDERTFRIFGTGHPIPDEVGFEGYLGSTQAPPFVWHVFVDPR